MDKIEEKIFIDFSTGKISNENNEPISNNVIKDDFKLAIVGSRSITDEKFVNRIINCFKYIYGTPIEVISGGAKGIDSIGEAWANSKNIKITIFKPDWEQYGNSAGMIRNNDIIKNCDICLAIWDGESKGTKNDFELCKKYAKRLIIFNMKEYNESLFSGFYDIIFFNNEPIQKEIEVKEESETYTITFKNGEEIVRTVTGPMGTYVSVPSVEKEGYEFLGWSIDGKKVTMPVDGIYDSDITYIALWEKIKQEEPKQINKPKVQKSTVFSHQLHDGLINI